MERGEEDSGADVGAAESREGRVVEEPEAAGDREVSAETEGPVTPIRQSSEESPEHRLPVDVHADPPQGAHPPARQDTGRGAGGEAEAGPGGPFQEEGTGSIR